MPRLELLQITVEPLEEARIVRATGELDLSNAETLGRELDAAREEARTTLLDLSGVTFIDSSGLHLLLEASRSSAANGWAFSIVRPSEAVRRLISLSRTAEVLALA
jgi:anti-anti-sigma factor